MNKIKEEQLKTIQEHQKELNTILNEVGFLEAQKHALMHRLGEVNSSVEEFKRQLEQEYGAININVEDGTYTVLETKTEETSVPEEVEEGVANPL